MPYEQVHLVVNAGASSAEVKASRVALDEALASSADVVVACGGDGTVTGVAEVLAGTNVRA